MSDSISGRPITSAPPTSISPSEPDSETIQSPRSGANDSKYWIPHIFDFVVMGGQVQESTTSNIPSVFLQPQAVDTSVIIGHGATFTAAVRSLPPSQPSEVRFEADGVDHTRTIPASPRPAFVVYKTVRVEFLPKGEPVKNDRSTMAAAMMEIYALIHPPLLNHPNIIDILGLAWGGNPYKPAHRLPVIVVEFAEHGTLADLQNGCPLTSKTRKSLCLDVALGLDILHRCGIIHGDVKSENVLICSHAERQYVAKVADFGYSSIEATAADFVSLGGTRPWKAPETTSRVPKDQLKLTDVYSFGMLVWRVALDGMSPFEFVIAEHFQADQRQVEAERLKQENEIVTVSRLENWYFRYFLASKAYKASPMPTSAAAVLERLQQYNAIDERTLDEFLHFIGRFCTVDECPISLKNKFKIMVRTKMLLDPFYGALDSIFEKCLSKTPESRDFGGAIELLQKGDLRSPSDTKSDDIKLDDRYTHHVLSSLRMQTLDPSIETLVFNAYEANRKEGVAEGTLHPQYFTLAACYINGYGTEPDTDEAVLLLSTASKYHSISAAYYYRICTALNIEIPQIQPIVDVLTTKSLEGARMALQDLETLAPEKAQSTKETLRNFLAGIGADFFHKKNMLYGGSIRGWVEALSEKELRAQRLDPIRDSRDIHAFPINKRGDSILHMAASCGILDAVEDLVDNYSMRVNHLNEQGETPLLCACRAGQAATARSLLKRGADASMATPHKESPLHWLVSFSGIDVETVGDMLLGGGANAHLVNTKPISYSIFPSLMDADCQQPGTPLCWAARHNRADIVKYLLDRTDPTTILTTGNARNALHWAAFAQRHQCVEMMLDAFELHKINFTFGPYIKSAVMGSDKFHMMLRHGPKYKVMFQATMDLFYKRAKGAIFSDGLGGFGYSLLYFAVERSQDLVVEYLLPVKPSQEPNEQRPAVMVPGTSKLKMSYSREDRGLFSPKDINRACGPGERTPLLESVRRNRKAVFHLLRRNGADVLATSKNPFNYHGRDWTALHVFAYAGHDADISLVDSLVGAGIPVDGRPAGDEATETPLTVAIHHNAFHLASKLLELGADINALSIRSAFTTVEHPMTVLGHVIVANCRYSTPRLKYLLFECMTSDEISFVVEPHRNISALHRAAWTNHDVRTASEIDKPYHDPPHPPTQTETSEAMQAPAPTNPPALDAPAPSKTPDPPPDPASQTPKPASTAPTQAPLFDLPTNHDIIYELLQRYHTPAHLNARCRILDRTALHLVVEAANAGALERLLDRGADREVEDGNGETPGGLATRLLGEMRSGEVNGRKKGLERIARMLGEGDGRDNIQDG